MWQSLKSGSRTFIPTPLWVSGSTGFKVQGYLDGTPLIPRSLILLILKLPTSLEAKQKLPAWGPSASQGGGGPATAGSVL